jgi:hypothetical protein
MLLKELQDLQRQHGCRPRAALHDLAERLKALFFEVYGVASFYPRFCFEPFTSTISTCTDLRCRLAGAEAVRATLQVACDRVEWPGKAESSHLQAHDSWQCLRSLSLHLRRECRSKGKTILLWRRRYGRGGHTPTAPDVWGDRD